MSAISKQALLVDNSTSFPNNNAGEITPSDLRAFNVNVIDSTVNQTEYTSNSGSWNVSIGQLNAFTASQQPSFNGLNAFTASQLSINSGVNAFTQSTSGRLTALESETSNLEAFTSSINQIIVNGASIGTSTRFFFNGLVSASIVPNVDGPIANITILTDNSFTPTASFNAYTASTNAWTASAKISIADFNSASSSFATTGSNTYTGTQTITNGNTITMNVGSRIRLFEQFGNDTSAIQFWSGSSYTENNPRWVNMQPQPGGGGTLAISAFPENNHFVFFNPAIWTTQFESVVTGYGDGDRLKIGSGLQVTGSSIISGSIDVTGSTSVQGTFNVAGVQTINYTNGSGLGEVYLLADSGSLVIGNSLSQPAYGSLAHLSSSTQNGNTNLIFKPNTSTGDTIISGSSNIFTNPAAATAGFKRYVGGSQNYFGATLPQITGSAGFSPSINNNILNTGMVMRIPVSSSAYTMNGNIVMNPASNGVNLGTSATLHFEKAVSGLSFLNNGLFGASMNLVANGNILSSSVTVSSNLSFGGNTTLNSLSSSISYNSNINNGSLTINNRFTPVSGSTAAVLSPRANTNTIYGTGHIVNIDGTNTSTTQGKSFSYNILAGTFLTASIGTGDASAINATAIIGNGLIVTGSTLTSTFAGADTANGGQGSAFVGRFNSLDGTKDQSAETVFAVGTGTSYTNRKTGFLIDSGSNTFIEGSLTITGSVYGNVSASTITSSTASIDLSVANYFTLTLTGATNINVLNPRPGVTATLVITTGLSGSATFSSNVKQPSGSAYIASPQGSTDIISLTSVDTGSVYLVSAYSFV